MELEVFYPKPDELVQQEINVLDFLRNNTYIKEKHSEFARDVGAYYTRNRGTDAGFEFFSHLDVSHDQSRTAAPNLRLILAARILRNKQAYSDVTYCLCVCRTRNLAVLRKFHFDVTITTGDRSRTQPQPRSHIQYCGTMIPQMSQMGVRPGQLLPMNPWLSEPRILAWPMSLALLLDMALREFPNAKSERFRAMPEWRKIVRDHESLLLLPFLEQCTKVIKNTSGCRQTLSDAMYVG